MPDHLLNPSTTPSPASDADTSAAPDAAPSDAGHAMPFGALAAGGVGGWLRRRAERGGARVAVLVPDGGAVTYAALFDRATRMARLLERDGVGKGDRVAYLGPNEPGFLVALGAAGLLGAVFVPLNTLLSGREIAHQVADCGARVLLHSASVPPPPVALPVREVGGPDGERELARASAEPVTTAVAADDPCLILYTSGTTGQPKGAVLTHGNVLANCLNAWADLDLTGTETALVTAPMFHAAALGMLALPVLLKGGTCLLTPSFDAGRALDLIGARRVTSLFAVPTMLERMAEHPAWADADLTSLRTLLCGGAPVPEKLLARYAERGVAVREGYGLTEAAPGVLVDGGTGAGLVPHLYTDVRLAPLPGAPPETGELLVRGPQVMAGYWGRPADTEAAFTDGWLRTGDIARRLPDGSYRIVDRLKEVIISGGENIYPAEVERALLAVPGVAECAVIGVPDARWGEVGRAVLVAAPGAALDPEAVLAALRGRLATFKIPRSAVVVTDLPHTRTGKVHRRAVKDRHG
ncbi:AMP-binding protein [Actinocorallia sp. API 0066]|uniref:AMP-binding protein n=1 Tax=Actinocorallia sp. API 0066 TaxID=2896846 RepID=UPI001E3D12F4|nr:AMP-binding protein [Actinocorallia sp. API 0066]MCD0449758.1 AMP-binding protein [Actinocorallia sp. API 0066]